METSVDTNDSKVWPEPIIKTFVRIMVDEVTKGNMQNGVFQTRTWNLIKDKLNSTTKRSFNLKQIKQKFNRLRSRHREFALLLQQSGFGWNPATNTVTAAQDVWESYLRVHPDAAQFKKKGLEDYESMKIIFNRSTATGVLHHSSTQDPPNTNEENELDNQYINSGVHVDLEHESSSDDVTQTFERATRSGKRKIHGKERKHKKESKTFEIGEALQEWAKASKAKAEYSLARAEMCRGKSSEANSSTASSDYSVASCVIALEGIEGISDDTYSKAVDAFKEKELREAFLTMSNARKPGWLRRLK